MLTTDTPYGLNCDALEELRKKLTNTTPDPEPIFNAVMRDHLDDADYNATQADRVWRIDTDTNPDRSAA